MYNPNYELSDKELLAKYGLKQYSNYEELSLQVVLLYCFKNGYDISLEADEQQQIEFFLELMPTLPDVVREVFRINMSRPHRFYDAEIAWNVYDRLRNVPKEELSRIYSQLLVALVQASEPFITNGCYDYKHTLFLSEALTYAACESIDYDQRKYPFLWILMPFSAEATCPINAPIDNDKLYRFIMSQISDINVCPSTVKDQSLSDCGTNYISTDDVEWDEYMNNLGFFSIALIDPTEFSQTFFRFLDRYESVDQIWVPYFNEWQHTSAKNRVIQSCIEERMLSEVITDGEKSILVLTTRWGTSEVDFKKFLNGHIVDYPGISRRVPFDEIIDCDYSLNPKMYVEAECDENHEIIPLGEVCELDVVGDMGEVYYDFVHSAPKSYHLLPDYHFSRSLAEVYRNADVKKYYGVDTLDVIDGDRMLYNGPHVHITEEGEFVLNNAVGYYLCPKKKNWALKVKDNRVSLEYLLYALSQSKAFMDFVSSSPSSELLLKKKVPIIKDRAQQDEVVDDFKERNLPIVTSSNVYNVALIVPNPQDWLTTSMEECWYLNVQEFDHIKGDDGLLNILDKGQVSVDAIIVDAEVDSVRGRYKGLRDLLSRFRGSDIPVYLYTDVDDESLQDDLSEEEYQYVVEGKLFRRNEETSIDRLVRNLRTELDGEDNHTAKIRGQYVREFEAASWLDQKFPNLCIPSDLEYCISNPNDAFPKVRAMLNGLYKAIMRDISNGSGLDQVKNVGMLPSLLKDGKYDNKNQTAFVIRGSVMPLPLAISLRFASDIANGELHMENSKMDIRGYHRLVMSDNLAHAVIRVLMDFIIWLREVNFEFDGYCLFEDANLPHVVDWKGVLKQAGPREFYCDVEDVGPVRVLVDLNKLEKICAEKVGKEISIKKVSVDTQMMDKYDWKADKRDWE